MLQTWTIGSAASCDIPIKSSFVSGKHCRLEYDGAQWVLEDLGSTNGTFINGVKLSGRSPITKSDTVTLGTTQPLPWPDVAGDAVQTPVKMLQLPRVGATLIIGRGAQCDIVLDFPMISTRHASIEYAQGGWIVRDLGSSNGTFYRGHRLTDAEKVGAGEVISLGSYRLTLSADVSSVVERNHLGTTSIEVSGLGIDVPGRRLIADVSLTVQPGELVGLMGPSGSGKSTLLAAVVGYQPPAEGRVTISGVDVYARFDELRGQIGYVPQDDIMHTDLTVQQALWYSARLRLPADFSNAEIQRRITNVLKQLGLTGTEHTRIGSAAKRGISGGQRKRVNVAMELLTDPPMLVLDEPTSGLSSVDSLSLMRLLRELANAGKTIVLTIHQPSIDVLKLMDGLIVIAKDASSDNVGKLVWYGPAYPDAADFFEPANAGKGQPDAEAILRGLDRGPVAKWLTSYHNTTTYDRLVLKRKSVGGSASAVQARHRPSLFHGVFQWWMLVLRTLALKLADTWNTGILLAQAPIIALLISGVFGKTASEKITADNWANVSKAVVMTAFLLALAAIWFGCSNSVREIVSEKAVYKRERMVGLSLYSYVCSKLCVLGLLCFMQCGILLVFTAVGCELAGNWGFIFAVLFVAANVGVVIGLNISALVPTAEAAAGVLPLVIIPLVILGGSLLPLHELPPLTTYLADAMPSRWAFEGLCIEESNAKPLLEIPTQDPPHTPKKQDMAEPWFQVDGWRSSKATPFWVLAAMWGIGLFALRTILVHKDT